MHNFCRPDGRLEKLLSFFTPFAMLLSNAFFMYIFFWYILYYYYSNTEHNILIKNFNKFYLLLIHLNTYNSM